MVIGATANHTVFDIQNTVEDVERAMIVRDDDDAGAVLVAICAKSSMTCRPRSLSSAAVGSSARMRPGLIGQGAGDGDALLFAAGERFGEIVGARADAKVVEQLMRALAGGLRCGVVDFESDLDVLQRGEKRDEIGLLKHKAEILAAEGAQVYERTRSIQHGLAADGDLASGRWIDQRDRGQQRGFARAARAEHADDLATRDFHRDVAATTSVWPLP